MKNDLERFDKDLLSFIEVLSLTKRMEGGNYFTEKKEEITAYLVNRYSRYFDIVTLIGDNILFHKKFGRKNRPLIINGHYDVADYDNNWTKKVSGEIKGNKIYGRGAVDMKGPLTSAFSGLVLACEEKARLKNDIYFLINSDEEGSSSSMERFTSSKEAEQLINSYAVVAEPTDLKVGLCQKGLVFYQLRTTGGRVEKGVYSAVHDGELSTKQIPNAIEINFELFKLLKEYIRSLKPHSLLGNQVINLGVIKGSPSNRDQPNGVPNLCESKFTVRYTPNNEFATIDDELQSIVDRFRLEYKLEIDLIPYERYGGFETTPDSNLVAAALEATKKADLKRRSGPYNAYSNADFLNAMGIETIVFGPGNLNQGAHGVDEYIHKLSFHQGILAFYNLFKEGVR